MKEIRGIFSGCKCMACGHVDAYQRMGCRCYDMSRMQDDEYTKTLVMEYGLLVAGDTPKHETGFVSFKDILEHIKAGGKAFDPDGKEITEAMFAPDDEDA